MAAVVRAKNTAASAKAIANAAVMTKSTMLTTKVRAELPKVIRATVKTAAMKRATKAYQNHPENCAEAKLTEEKSPPSPFSLRMTLQKSTWKWQVRPTCCSTSIRNSLTKDEHSTWDSWQYWTTPWKCTQNKPEDSWRTWDKCVYVLHGYGKVLCDNNWTYVSESGY